MNRAYFRFYAELNFFLPAHRRELTFVHEFEGRASIKDTIESLGVPHTEVELILVSGEPVDFSYIVADGDECSVYPVFESLDISPALRLRPQPLRQTRFVLDVHLGKLANHLRMLGFDTLYRNDYPDEELAEISSSEGRILLTRDTGLLKRSIVTHGYYVRETNPRRQLIEVLRRFDLLGSIIPFCRCVRCNVLLEAVPKEAIIDRLPPQSGDLYDEFSRCPSCEQIFWKGTHYERMQEFIAGILQESSTGAG
ncbi:MAG: Mut7-C ubiquitin/RNAse domain-containing protein [Oscillatoria princeps RMCB-10]|jgi:uncharacterized protein with PIN domain|nr:Mut7-C ubiquitin/RNAse domain-containing protein [Oscillatoria princeps RMCB-10]